MKPKYIQSKNQIDITTQETSNICDKLPLGIYTLEVQEGMTGSRVFLANFDKFNINFKLYGDTEKNTERIIKTYSDRLKTKSTGVLLAGDKGSGKTLLAKNISKKLLEKGISTIIIKDKIDGSVLCTFLSQIKDPALVIFDEFEKIYEDNRDRNNGEQNSLLGLFDGMFSNNKLFILTCNNPYMINDMLMNRPGRMYYYLEFHSINEEAIREYCKDNLKNKKYIEQIVNLSNSIELFTMDILKSLVEEMNRFNESPIECLKFLNIEMVSQDGEYIMIVKDEKNKKILCKKQIDIYNLDNLRKEISIPKLGRDIWLYSSDIIKIEKGIIYIKTKENLNITLTKQKNKDIDIMKKLIL